MNDIQNENNALRIPYGCQEGVRTCTCTSGCNYDAKAQEAAIELICGELSMETWRCFRGVCHCAGYCADESRSDSYQEGCAKDDHHDDDDEMAFAFRPLKPKLVRRRERESGTKNENGNHDHDHKQNDEISKKSPTMQKRKRQNHNRNHNQQQNQKEEGPHLRPRPQKATKTEQKRKVKNFEERMVELAEYKERFGHCNVPLKYPSLGRWCHEVRASYRHTTSGNQHSNSNSNRRGLKMDAERIQRLEAIGFRFGKVSKTFEEHVEDLRKFKETYGHCRVNHVTSDSDDDDDYPELRSWCYSIRNYRRNNKHDYEKKILTPEQMDLLMEMESQWTTSTTGTSTCRWTVKSRPFESYMEELRKFQKRHGHCNVPRSHPTLGKWSISVRRAHQRIMRNKKCNKKLMNRNTRLTLEQIEELDAIGFRWSKSRQKDHGMDE